MCEWQGGDLMITFIDLFCGVGGIRMGMEYAGFKCVFSSDINAECQKVYELNYNEKPSGDITKIKESDIPEHDILCAGFPCQPFSISGKMKGFDDTRGTLFFEVARIIKAKKPKLVLLENVKHLVHHDKGRTLMVILETLKQLGYQTEWQILNASDFGVPQNRERIIIIARQDGIPFDFSSLNKCKASSMESILQDEGDFEYLEPSEYTLIQNPVRQPSGLIFAGYRNKKIRKAGVRPGTEHLSRVHKQPNRIYSVEGIHPTLPSQETTGRYWILLKNNRVRKLTLLECWRLMGFPDTFKKSESVAEQYKQLGNSVCVPVFKALAEQIKKQVF